MNPLTDKLELCAKRLQTELGFPKPHESTVVLHSFTYFQVMERLHLFNPDALVQEVDRFIKIHDGVNSARNRQRILINFLKVRLESEPSKCFPLFNNFNNTQSPSSNAPQQQVIESRPPGNIVILSASRWRALLGRVPFFVQWEIGRFIQADLLEWPDVQYELIKKCKEAPEKVHEHLVQIWREKSKIGGGGNITFRRLPSLFDKPDDIVWDYVKATSEQITSRPSAGSPRIKVVNSRSIHYVATLRISETGDPKITLEPLVLGASNRFFRKYESNRFLQLKIPSSVKNRDLSKLGGFFLNKFELLNHTYSFLFAKENTLYFFATETWKDQEMTSISVRSVIDWHIPIDRNKAMLMSKFWSRMDMGFSSTTPSVNFTHEQLRGPNPDIIGAGLISDEKTENIMTDGCAPISCAAMKAIGDMYNGDKNCLTPTAIQGRINGAKGVWFLDPGMDFDSGKWISIRKSQHKFKTGIRDNDPSTYDSLHYTLDICKVAKAVCPSFINTQVILVLASGGVPAASFVDIMQESIERIIGEVQNCDEDPLILRNFVTRVGKVMTKRRELLDFEWGSRREADEDAIDLDEEDEGMEVTFKDDISGYPTTVYETCISLLDSGFRPSTCSYLASKMTIVLQCALKQLFSRYRFEVLQSCTAMCIADPLGILEPGEIFLQTDPYIDEWTRMETSVIVGDIILARSPCTLPSDVQKVKAVDKTELRAYKNVVIFPTKGEVSLASLLSGGDYDGDIVFCCWDPRITTMFENSKDPYDMPVDFQENHFEQQSSTVCDVLGLDNTTESEQELRLQRIFFELHQRDNFLGIYENWRVIVAETMGFKHKDAIYLAQMCSQLVDAPKQGLRLKPEVLNKDDWRFNRLPAPRWFADMRKSKGNASQGGILDRQPETVMDILHEVLTRETEKIKRRGFPVVSPTLDLDLQKELRDIESTAHDIGDRDLLKDMESIKQVVEALSKDYNKEMREIWNEKHRQTDQARRDRNTSNKPVLPTNKAMSYIAKKLLELDAKYTALFYSNPDPTTFTSMSLRFDAMKQVKPFERTNRLKASYAYQFTRLTTLSGFFCWHMAFRTLCQIKADASSSRPGYLARPIVDDVYTGLTVDQKWLRRIRKQMAEETL